MASSIDIEVNLESKEATKGLKRLEGAGEAVGETFGSMGEAVGKLGGEMNEQLGAVGETVGGLSNSFMELSTAASAPGASFISLLGPIGAVMIAVVELSKAFEDYSGKTKESEMRIEAYEAATAELTGAVEELSAAQVSLTASQIEQLKTMSMAAKVPLELAQNLRTANATRLEAIAAIDKQIESEKELFKVTSSIAAGYVKTTNMESSAVQRLRKQREKLQAKVDETEARSLQLTAQGARSFAEFEAKKEELLKQSPEFRKNIAEQELKLQEQAQIDSLESVKDSQEAQTKIAVIESRRRVRELRAIEDISDAVRFQAITAEQTRREAQISAIEKAFAEKRAKEREARAKQKEAREKMEATRKEMLERQSQQEIFALRALSIQSLKQQGADEMAILSARYQLEIDQAGDSANRRLMAEMRFEMAKTELIKQQEQKRLEQELSIKAQLDAEAERRHKKFMSQIDEQNQKIKEQVELGIAAIPVVGDLAQSFASGFAEAPFGALAMGEGFQESIVRIIEGLGKQATVQALMETAKGVSALILNPALAATHFKAAGIFGGVAALAGVSASSLGGSGGSAGAAGAGVDSAASPSGAPQTAPTPQRETAQETSTVFNINFGGAVIYDTKQAAERAMVDRLVSVINQRNRGSRRLNLGSV